MPRPSDPHAKTRLLEAALGVFSEKGLDRAKVEDITTRAGLSKGAFYLHFESKSDAFKELLSEVLEQLQTRLRKDLPSLAQGFEQALERWLERDLEMFEFVWKNRALMRITLEGGRSADYQHLIEHFALHAQRETEVLLAQGIAAGIYRADLDVPVAAAFIAGGYDRFARQLVREVEKPNLKKRLRELRWIVLMGAGTPNLIQRLRDLAPPESEAETSPRPVNPT